MLVEKKKRVVTTGENLNNIPEKSLLFRDVIGAVNGKINLVLSRDTPESTANIGSLSKQQLVQIIQNADNQTYLEVIETIVKKYHGATKEDIERVFLEEARKELAPYFPPHISGSIPIRGCFDARVERADQSFVRKYLTSGPALWKGWISWSGKSRC